MSMTMTMIAATQNLAKGREFIQADLTILHQKPTNIHFLISTEGL